MPSQATPVASSILIIGSGVFGLSTAYALATRDEFKSTTITVIDRSNFPAPDGASIDSSRIIRTDYADEHYAQLMAEAHPYWRGHWGADGRYMESGLCIVTEDEDDESAGETYMRKAMENVAMKLGLKVGRREAGGQVEPLNSEVDVRRVTRAMGGSVGRKGYVNWTSGWADAEAGMRYLYTLAKRTGRIHFHVAEAKRLHFTGSRVASVELSDSTHLTADLTILSAGAWTPRFIDLRGVASATGQVLAYTSLTPSEQKQLGSNPTLLCEKSGMFIIPPSKNLLKVARHGYGYANPTSIPHPEGPLPHTSSNIIVSLPWTIHDDPNLQIPPEGDRVCRTFLSRAIPSLASRPWTHTRLCWYLDTRRGDFLITYHPKYANLFLATGGSGHGYKFLPVIGERVVDIILRQDRDELGTELRKKWAWPQQDKFGTPHVWTEDWRGGVKGMELEAEMNKRTQDLAVDGSSGN